MQTNLLHLKNIEKTLGGKEVLKGINLELTEGEFVALLGESGAGKTTLLRCIAGLEILDAGQVTLRDEKVTGPEENLVPGHPEIAIVKQDFDLFANHNIYDLLEYKLRGYSEDYINTRIAELLEKVGIPTYSKKHLYEISGGEHQRVAIAQALAGDPSLLLFDESFSHLDSRNTRTLFQEVNRLIKEMNIAVIFATHQTELAMAYADKIVVMEKGEIVQAGNPESIYSHPVNRYTAELFGELNYLKNNTYIRPENVVITASENGDFEVVSQKFVGGKYRLCLKSATYPSIIAYIAEPLSTKKAKASFPNHKTLQFAC